VLKVQDSALPHKPKSNKQKEIQGPRLYTHTLSFPYVVDLYEKVNITVENSHTYARRTGSSVIVVKDNFRIQTLLIYRTIIFHLCLQTSTDSC
jgi:hypothetical protein